MKIPAVYAIMIERSFYVKMPLKIRKLKAALSRAGFYSRSAKGSHTAWKHSSNPAIRVTLSGKDGDDAQQYQIDDVRAALRKVGKDL